MSTNQTEQKKKKGSGKGLLAIFLAVVAVIAVVVLTTLYFNQQPHPVDGTKLITIVVTARDEEPATTKFATDAEYLAQALMEQGLVNGTEGAYGLYITEVNGVVANEAEQEWWCITKSGEMLNTGASDTPVNDGDQFELTLTAGYE